MRWNDIVLVKSTKKLSTPYHNSMPKKVLAKFFTDKDSRHTYTCTYDNRT